MILFPGVVRKTNLTLADSHIETNGSIYLFNSLSTWPPPGDGPDQLLKLRIVDSNLTAGENLGVFGHGWGNKILQLEIDNSELHARGGNLSLVRAIEDSDIWSQTPKYFSSPAENNTVLLVDNSQLLINNSRLTAKDNLALFADPVLLGKQGKLDVTVKDSSLHAEAGRLGLFGEIVEPGRKTL